MMVPLGLDDDRQGAKPSILRLTKVIYQGGWRHGEWHGLATITFENLVEDFVMTFDKSRSRPVTYSIEA